MCTKHGPQTETGADIPYKDGWKWVGLGVFVDGDEVGFIKSEKINLILSVRGQDRQGT